MKLSLRRTLVPFARYAAYENTIIDDDLFTAVQECDATKDAQCPDARLIILSPALLKIPFAKTTLQLKEVHAIQASKKF